MKIKKTDEKIIQPKSFDLRQLRATSSKNLGHNYVHNK